MTFARKPGSPFSSFATPKTRMKRTEMKKRAKRKPTVAEGLKYIDACRNEECYLRVPGVCVSRGWSHDSVVDCHSNQSRHGKAGGRRADNIYTVPGCGPCHAWIDQNRAGTPRQVKFDVWDAAYEEWRFVRAKKMGMVEEVECTESN